MMKARLVLAAAALLLAGCTDARARLDSTVNDVVDTASGRITEVENRVDSAVQPIVDTVNTVQDGVQKVQSGAKMLKDGVDTIKGVVNE